MKDWRKACTRLWGADWIAPLADVLGVSRRTIERWKAETIPIPERIRRDLIDLVIEIDAAADGHNETMRVYGSILRRLANGESPDDIRGWILDHVQALDHAVEVRGRYLAISDPVGEGEET